MSSRPCVPAVTLSNKPLSTARSKLPSGKPVLSASEAINSQSGKRARMLSITPYKPAREGGRRVGFHLGAHVGGGDTYNPELKRRIFSRGFETAGDLHHATACRLAVFCRVTTILTYRRLPSLSPWFSSTNDRLRLENPKPTFEVLLLTRYARVPPLGLPAHTSLKSALTTLHP